MANNIFNQDVIENQGYYYTTNISLSSRLAGRRMTDVTLESLAMAGKTILDVGCGDGTHTRELAQYGAPGHIIAGDTAEQAVKVAQDKADASHVSFLINSAYRLPFADKHFDIAVLRAVLHHLDDPEGALREALRVAKLIWVVEPNGYNPGLKYNERFSRYHLEHAEKSYAPHILDQWVKRQNGKILSRRWAGFVPMFCPDWLARVMKAMEPVVEKVPVINRMGCAIYYLLAESPS